MLVSMTRSQVGNQYGKMSKRGKALDKEMRERIKQRVRVVFLLYCF